MPNPASPSPRPRHARGALGRVLAGLWLLLHVFTVAALPVADGLADHSDAVVAHIEDAEGGNCPASHSDSCDLCQFTHGLRGLAEASSAYSLPSVERRALTPVGNVTAPADFTFLDGHSSRAPPALG